MNKSEKYWRELSQKIEDTFQMNNKHQDTSVIEIDFIEIDTPGDFEFFPIKTIFEFFFHD